MGSSSARTSHRPRNVASPRILGAAVVEKTVVGARGEWSGAPTRFRYAWLRCSKSGRACRRIPRGNRQRYKIQVRDAGRRLRLAVRAANGAGSSVARSRPSRIVSMSPTGPPPPPPPASACGTRHGRSAITKVLWILMENKNYTSIVGSRSAPFENQIAQACGLATNYHAVAHPSLPNYVALTSGSTQGITNDAGPGSHRLDVPTIYHQAYPSAKGYAEGMASNCATGGGRRYYVRHALWPYYVNGRAGNQHTECLANDVPMGTVASGSFHDAVANGRLPAFSLVTPDSCNDMHDCGVATGDAWLAGVVPRILAGRDYVRGRLAVVIVFDENSGASGNQVYCAVISPFTRPRTRSSVNFTHYSLLRTTEEILGLRLLGNARTATSMRAAFGW